MQKTLADIVGAVVSVHIRFEKSYPIQTPCCCGPGHPPAKLAGKLAPKPDRKHWVVPMSAWRKLELVPVLFALAKVNEWSGVPGVRSTQEAHASAWYAPPIHQ